MNFSETICNAFEFTIHNRVSLVNYSILILPLIISVITIVFFAYKLHFKIRYKLIALIVIGISAFVPVFIITLFIGLFSLNDSSWAMNYGNLNAAIKNTCYLDPDKINCPRNLDQLISIEDKEFEQHRNKLTYKYYSETNQYTLIVRDQPYRAVIFDPRIASLDEPDFKEVEVSKCGGDHVIDPPNFSGPWNFK